MAENALAIAVVNITDRPTLKVIATCEIESQVCANVGTLFGDRKAASKIPAFADLQYIATTDADVADIVFRAVPTAAVDFPIIHTVTRE